ncbi:MAG: aminotransferase class III-fold pyridoxal phosphate-dependent enzyme [Deltaproteobacteria bacterium]|jgi:adenosylmethionine-8-amino-7-oxononanoate aminotransferase|nr:aminotransferase class III-fold pyridoxal phosphate-dependent enzyme [Deltaproteobacteria bacterium]
MFYDKTSNLILHRTSDKEIQDGVLTIVKGDGIYVEDSDGRRYVDMDSGITRPVALGYGQKEIAQAAYDQIMKIAYVTPCGRASDTAMKLAAKLATMAPGQIKYFTFECSGSEAVDSAMKLAKLYHYHNGEKNRYKVVSRQGAYHGVNGLGLRALGTVVPMRNMFEPGATGGVFIPSPYCYRCFYRLRHPDCGLRCAEHLEEAIILEGPELISTFIGEPVQQGFGSYSPPDGYWQAVRKICDKYGVLMISDEVICGFGRTGKMFGIEHFGVEPDIISMAKCLTSGYVPLSGVGVTEKVWSKIDSFVHLHTYGNHPVGCAAALAAIGIYERDNLVARAAEIGKYLLDVMTDRLKDYPSVGEVRGKGLWVSADLTADKKTRPVFPAANLGSIVNRAMAKGYLIKAMGSAIELAPPYTIGKEDIDKFMVVFEACLQEEEKAMGLRK